MLNLIKTYLNTIAVVIGGLFLGWVWFLKVSNDTKSAKIDKLNLDLKTQEAICKEELKVSEFKGSTKVLKDNLNSVKIETKEAYEKAEKGKETYEKDTSTSNSNNFTFV